MILEILKTSPTKVFCQDMKGTYKKKIEEIKIQEDIIIKKKENPYNIFNSFFFFSGYNIDLTF